MRLVDFHTHFFSSVYFKTLASQSPLPGEVDSKVADVAKKAKLEIPGDDHAEHTARWLAQMETFGVEHLCAFGSVPEETGVVAQAAAASKGRIHAFAMANPRVEGVAGRIDGLLAERKIRGVLMLPALHQYKIDGSEAKALFEVLDARGAIAYVHCGLLVVKLRDLLGIPRTQDVAFANPLSLIPAANAHPRAHFVIPHFGAGFFRETLMAGAQAPNVYVDTSSSNSWIKTQESKLTLRDVFERSLDVFGAKRILFGTDSNTFPAGWRNDRYEEQHAALASTGADVATQELIFAGNAKRLLGIA